MKSFLVRILLTINLLLAPIVFSFASASVPKENVYDHVGRGCIWYGGTLTNEKGEEESHHGSGFVIKRNGDLIMIETAAHVVKGLDNPYIKFYRESESVWKNRHLWILSVDKVKDVAVVGCDKAPSNVVVLPFAKTNAHVGDEIFARGIPLWYEDFIFSGHIASSDLKVCVAEDIPWPRVFLDFNPPPGMSGSPICNKNGEVVAMFIAGYRDVSIGIAASLNDLKSVVPVSIEKHK